MLGDSAVRHREPNNLVSHFSLLSQVGFGVLQHLQMQPMVVISQSGSEEKQNKITRNIVLGEEED